MNQNSAELVPFELLHLELVSQIIHNQAQSEQAQSSDSAATSKLELLGYNAGYRLIERLAKDFPKFKDELDLLKFICKDFWVAIFRSVGQLLSLLILSAFPESRSTTCEPTTKAYTFCKTIALSFLLKLARTDSTSRPVPSSWLSPAAWFAVPSPTSA